MKWNKKGNIFNPVNHRDWAGTHAQVPTVLVKEDRLRIYYADRNSQGQSFPTFIDVEIENPSKVLSFHKRPVIDFGRPGTFDDEGVMPAFVTEDDGRILMYYSGWNRRSTVPYHNATGIAESHDGGTTFKRIFEGPIMDRTPLEPYLAVTPCIIKEESCWHMWYISGTRWASIEGRYEPVYVIKYANSRDGIIWERPNILCIEPKHELEAFSHPFVLKREGIYLMWYCFRNSHDYRDGTGSYRIGYAESVDGVHWERMDDRAGITVSDEGWDSKMICYPYITVARGTTYMFYNGNGFGQTGIGYATLEE
jgi:hypothetical protein